MIPTIKQFEKDKAMETVKRSVVTRGAEGEKWIGRAQRLF